MGSLRNGRLGLLASISLVVPHLAQAQTTSSSDPAVAPPPAVMTAGASLPPPIIDISPIGEDSEAIECPKRPPPLRSRLYSGLRDSNPVSFVEHHDQLIGPIFTLMVRGSF